MHILYITCTAYYNQTLAWYFNYNEDQMSQHCTCKETFEHHQPTKITHKFQSGTENRSSIQNGKFLKTRRAGWKQIMEDHFDLTTSSLLQTPIGHYTACIIQMTSTWYCNLTFQDVHISTLLLAWSQMALYSTCFRNWSNISTRFTHPYNSTNHPKSGRSWKMDTFLCLLY